MPKFKLTPFVIVSVLVALGIAIGPVLSLFDQSKSRPTEAPGGTPVVRIPPETSKETVNLINRGNTFARQGDYDQAIAEYSQILVLLPKFVEVYRLRGRVYAAKGDTAHAIEDLNKAISLNAADADSYQDRANIYNTQRDYLKALADYSKAIELKPGNATLFNDRGGVYVNRNDYEKALADFSKAIDLAPNDPTAYFNRGFVLYNLNQYDKAVASLPKPLNLNPTTACRSISIAATPTSKWATTTKPPTITAKRLNSRRRMLASITIAA